MTNNGLRFEILLATMNRTSLGFLTRMFPEGNFVDFNILIINQTVDGKLLTSGYDNIRVINNFDKGLSNSRNLAINNAIGDICLLADDDVTYRKGFDQIIIDAYSRNAQADIITFKMQDVDGNDFKEYADKLTHDFETIKNVNSVVITFNRQQIINNNLWFDELFGLGAVFETADEYLFMRQALQQDLKLIFEPKVILHHPKYSSGQDNGSDRLVFARAALYYKCSSKLGYLKLVKYLYLINKQGYITSDQLIAKLKIGLQGIKHYKMLMKKKSND